MNSEDSTPVAFVLQWPDGSFFHVYFVVGQQGILEERFEKEQHIDGTRLYESLALATQARNYYGSKDLVILPVYLGSPLERDR